MNFRHRNFQGITGFRKPGPTHPRIHSRRTQDPTLLALSGASPFLETQGCWAAELSSEAAQVLIS